MTENAVYISIVVPLLNEEGNLVPLYNELKPVLNKISGNHEIIFVDDGSTDQSFEIIKKLSQNDICVKGISLSRNFGHQVAIMAGMQESKGELVIMMDADLQHPPMLIPEMIQKQKDGFDIVNSKRIDSSDTGSFKKGTSKLFYTLLNKLSDTRIEPAAADFRLLTRKAVDSFVSMPERDRFTRGLISWMGFRQTVIDYHANPRLSGKSKYSLRKMLKLGFDGITSFSSKPLRMAFYTGLSIFIIGLLYAIYAIVGFFLHKNIQGWTSLLVSVLIIGGIQLLCIGIIGEYIARIFNESKGRPMYFIKDKV